MPPFPLHTASAILSVGLLLAGAGLLMPGIKGPQPQQFAAIVDLDPERSPISPLIRHVEPDVAPPPRPRTAVKPSNPLLDDSNGVLDHFYQSLWRTEKKERGAVTRIVHYGDSPTTADLITGDIRKMLQTQFGDAGHGFVLAAQPWAWYQHTGVELSASGWVSAPASSFEARDGMFGLGGVSFTGGPGAHSRIRLERAGDSRVEVWFLAQPDGGTLTISANAKPLGTVDAGAEAKAPGYASFDLEPGTRELHLSVDRGTVRIFGISVEKPGPGVVYDSIGLNGASVTVLSRMFNEKHWAAELQHRKPNLVIVNYGTNEADFDAFVKGPYEKELREAIRRIRTAVPGASILVMSPMDRGHHAGSKEIETMPAIPRIVAIQRRVARETGCGFFDTFAAMGGEGTMARWYAAKPRLVSADFIHPYPAGGKIIAGIFTREIGFGLNVYKLRLVERKTTSPPAR